MWNQIGAFPDECEAILESARLADPTSVVRKGDQTFPTQELGVTVLGTPHRDYVQERLRHTVQSHSTLFERIQAIPDLQSAWLVFLFCAAARANFLLRTVHPTTIHQFASSHDDVVWECLCSLLNTRGDARAQEMTTLPLSVGLGLRSASRTCVAAFWESWVDTLPMIRARHPHVADAIVVVWSRNHPAFHLEGPVPCRQHLAQVGFEAPDRGHGARGFNPPLAEFEEVGPGVRPVSSRWSCIWSTSRAWRDAGSPRPCAALAFLLPARLYHFVGP